MEDVLDPYEEPFDSQRPVVWFLVQWDLNKAARRQV
jgi:hypothetical protein